MSFRVLGTGMYVPPRVVTNDDLSQFLETNDEWITQRVGVKERNISTNETAADMGAKAARAALENSGVAAEEIEKNFPKYHNKIDESKLTIIRDIEADYKRRQGNLVLGLAKVIKPYVRDKPKTLKLKPNDKQYKRRRAIATYNVRSLFNKFLRSFADDSELLERDFSHRLQDIEKEMEEERKRENGEKTEVNYKD